MYLEKHVFLHVNDVEVSLTSYICVTALLCTDNRTDWRGEVREERVFADGHLVRGPN
jgi:hypothetical protein